MRSGSDRLLRPTVLARSSPHQGLTQGQRLSLPILIEHLGRRRGGKSVAPDNHCGGESARDRTPAACRAAPSATYSPVSAPEPVAEDGQRDPADRCRACATADRQVWPKPTVRSRRVRGFPPERTNGTAVS